MALIPAQDAASRWSTDLIGRRPEDLGEAAERRRTSALGPVVVARLAGRQRGTDPLVRANRIHDGEGCGVIVFEGASPRIEENEIWGNTLPGIQIGGEGTDPLIRANRIHDGKGNGVFVHDGAAPRIVKNEIRKHAAEGIYISGRGTSPVVAGNNVRQGLDDGIYVRDAAAPTIYDNIISHHAGLAIRVEDDAEPFVGPNVISE